MTCFKKTWLYIACALSLISAPLWAGTELPVLPATVAVQGLSLHIDPQQSVYDAETGFSGAGTMFFPALGRELSVTYSKVKLDANAHWQSGNVKASIAPDLLKAAAIDDIVSPKFVGNFEGLKSFIRAARSHIDELPLMLNNLLSYQNADFGSLSVMLTEINISKEGTTAAMMALERMPEGIYLPFTRRDIPFNPLSTQAFAETQLALTATADVDDFQMPITFKKGDVAGTTGTYVTFDCNGLKVFHVEGFHKFTSGIITPSPASAPPVVATFSADVKSLRQFVVKVTIPKFTVLGADDVAFEIKDAVIDYSDSENPTALPEAYFKEMGSTAPTKKETWKGIYIGSVGVSLAALPMKDANNMDFAFGAKDMIYDKGNGFSATFAVKTAGIADVNIKGFRLILDEFNMRLKKNSLQDLNFLGSLAIPVLLDEKGALKYKATFNMSGDTTKAKFEIAVQFPNDIDLQVPLLELAGCKLQKTSVVKIFNKNKQWGVFANLQGNFNIGIKSNSLLSLGLPFEGWKIGDDPSVSTRSGAEELPMNFKAFDLNGDNSSSAPPKKMSGFPLTVDNITFATEKGTYKFGMDIGIALGGGSSSFQAKGGVVISAALQFSKLISKKPWEGIEFKDITTNRLDLKADMSAFTFSGSLDLMKNDPVYGNGFKADVALRVKVGKGFTLDAIALFGNKSDYSYFYVDANVTLPSPLPLVGPLMLHGFGGGIYSNMEQTLSADGKSNKYIPKKGTFGFMARVEVGLANRETFDAIGELQFQFRGNWELDFFKINVKAGLLNDLATVRPSALQPFTGSKVVGSCTMMYDNRNQTITANLSVKLQNLQVSGEGQLNMFFDLNDRSNWYVHLGTPEKPVNVRFAGFGVTMYLMLGRGIGELPSIEARVPKLAGMGLQVRSNQRNDPSKKSSMSTTGSGFAFGISYQLDQDFAFLFFSGNINAGFGVDAILRNDLGECNGQKMGWNGWYMAGQAYAYVGAKVDLDVNLLFIKGKFNIATLQVAAILEANLPTPKLLRGRVAARYSILGGIVNGQFSFGFELKEDNPCNVVAYPRSPAVGQPVVAVTYPDKKEEIQVFDDIIVSTNFAIRDVQSYDFQGSTYYYSVRVTQVEIKDGNKVLATMKNSDIQYKDEYTLVLTPRTALPAKANLQLVVSAEAYDTEPYGNIIKTVGRETRTVPFRTGERPEKVYAPMVGYAAPGTDQKYWYKGYAKPKVTLKQDGYEYLFDPNYKGIASEYKWLLYKKEGADSTLVGTYDINTSFAGKETLKVTAENGEKCGYTRVVSKKWERVLFGGEREVEVVTYLPKTCQYTVDVPNRSFYFDALNTLDLDKKGTYRIVVIRKPINMTQTKTAATTTVNDTKSEGSNAENDATMATRTLSVTKSDIKEIAIIYTNVFGISQYTDVADKITIPSTPKTETISSLGQLNINNTDNLMDNLPTSGFRPYLTLVGNATEPLDKYDIERIFANSSLAPYSGSDFRSSFYSTYTNLSSPMYPRQWTEAYLINNVNHILGRDKAYINKILTANLNNFTRMGQNGVELVINSVNVQWIASEMMHQFGNTTYSLGVSGLFHFDWSSNMRQYYIREAQSSGDGWGFMRRQFAQDLLRNYPYRHYNPGDYTTTGKLNYTIPSTVPERFNQPTAPTAGTVKAFNFSVRPPNKGNL